MGRRGLAALIPTLAVVGLVLGLLLTVGTGNRTPGAAHHPSLGAMHSVLGALTDTTAADNYAFDYTTVFQPGSGAGTPSPEAPLTTTGHGVVDLDPFVMVTTNSASSAFPGVTAVVDGQSVWEFGAGDYGTGPIAATTGNALPGFAQSVEGSLGQGQGALAMVSLANPMGRLSLDQSMIQSAVPDGSGTVDGVPVTNYRVTIDFAHVLDQPTLSAAQRETISQALAILSQQGYVDTTEVVSVASAGYIRQTKSLASFADGGTVSGVNTISDIGCAGTVTPGQPVAAPAPSGCASPDQPAAASATAPQGSS